MGGRAACFVAARPGLAWEPCARRGAEERGLGEGGMGGSSRPPRRSRPGRVSAKKRRREGRAASPPPGPAAPAPKAPGRPRLSGGPGLAPGLGAVKQERGGRGRRARRGEDGPFPSRCPRPGSPPPAEGARRRPPEPRPRAGAVRQPRGPGPAPCETGRPLRRRGLRLRRRVTERRLACWHSGLRALYLIPKLCAFSIRIRSALAVRLVFVLLAEETRLSWAIAGRPLGSGSGALGLRPAGSLCLSVSLWLTKPGLRRKPASRCSHSAAFPSLLPSS